MGTSMTVPDSLKQRLARKIVEQENRVTANKLTLQKGQNMIYNLSKASLQVQICNQIPSTKLKEQPQTAIREQNQLSVPNNHVEIRKIQVEVAEFGALAVRNSFDADGPQKQNNSHSIWQSMTEQTKNHFKRADQKRRQTIKTKSCVINTQIQIKQMAQQSCLIQPVKKDKVFSEIHSDRANQLLLSINSKFGHKVPTNPIKQIVNVDCSIKKQQILKVIIKKKILLPSVQIINSTKEKRKLKYIYQNEQIKIKEDRHWRATS